jgi:hypothetical protein
VGAELVDAVISNRAVEGHFAIDRKRFEVRGLRVVDEDVAVGGLGVDLAARIGDADAFVDRRCLHAAAGLVDGDHAFHGAKGDVAVAMRRARLKIRGIWAR